MDSALFSPTFCLFFFDGEREERVEPMFCRDGEAEAFRLLPLAGGGDAEARLLRRPLLRNRGDRHGLAKEFANRFLTVPGESYSRRTEWVMSVLELVFNKDRVDRLTLETLATLASLDLRIIRPLCGFLKLELAFTVSILSSSISIEETDLSSEPSRR